MKILGVGGGTLGPVTPLLATWKAIQRLHPEATLVWIGTSDGPEQSLLSGRGVQVDTLPVVKWPRYPSLRWLTFPFDWLRARRLAGELIDRHRPDVVMSVGGFTAVPVVYEASKRGIPCVTHQLDVEPGLANRHIASLCTRITTSFEYEHPPFKHAPTDERIPTPTRFHLHNFPTPSAGRKIFHLDPKKRVVLIIGGGTGSQFLNEMVHRLLKTWLPFTQILHSVGRGKAMYLPSDNTLPGYQGEILFEKNMAEAYAAADVVIARAGIGTLSEISALKKATIIIPLPHSHQEANAKAFEEQGAALVMHQSHSSFDAQITKTLELLVTDTQLLHDLGERAHQFFPTDDGTAFAQVVLGTLTS